MNISEIIPAVFPAWLAIIVLTLLTTVGLFIAKCFIVSWLERWIVRSSYHLDSLLISAVKFPLTIMVFTVSLLLFKYLLGVYGYTDSAINNSVMPILKALLIVSLVFFTDKFVAGLLGGYAGKSASLSHSKGIVQGTVHVVVLGLGALMLMGTLGISVTPVIASLGITSLAVALALRPTLENFFSGVQLLIDKPMRVGDFIELESGEQGFVEKIGWRSTWIKMLANNTIIMPNSMLSQSRIINYFYPEKELSVPVECSVHYNSNLEQVEQIALEVAREILISHEWGVNDYKTFVLFHTFSDSGINFTVMLRAKEYFNRFWVKSAFIKALHQRFKEEGITIPYPIRAINFDQEQVGQAKLKEPVVNTFSRASHAR